MRLERFSDAVRDKKSPRLMLLVPPRHGKSTLASVSFPAWHLGKYPKHEVVNASYNLDLPMRWSRHVRELFRSPTYTAMFPEARLSAESQGAESWMTTAGGSFTAVGVGGGLTGKGAHVLTIDDPIKNMEEADSIVIRDNLWEWYHSVAYTRLAPGGGVLVIETWWNDDDLAGRIQQLMQSDDPHVDRFEIVRYPAISEEFEYRDRQTAEIIRSSTPLEDQDAELLRAPVQALHPDRYDLDALYRIRANVSPRVWSALYQQSPVPDEGMYFKKDFFRYEPGLPHLGGTNVYTAWDFAIGEKQANDWTVGATGAQDESDILHVAEVNRFKGDALAIVEAMIDTAERYMAKARGRYMVGVEDGQIWKSIKPLFLRRMQERKVFPAYEVLKPLTDKMARARPLQGRMQQGRVVFGKAAWNPTVEQELLRFPAGAHDDCVDALAWLTHLVVGKPGPQKPPPKPIKSWKDRLRGSIAGAGHMSA